MVRELKVSMSTYGEIAALLEQSGVKINTGEPLSIVKTDKFVPPVDFRLVTIRRDIVSECAKVYSSDDKSDASPFLKFVDAVYQYVLNNKTETTTKEEV